MRGTNEGGFATVSALIIAIVLVSATGAILATTMAQSKERKAAADRQKALYAATSGVSHVLANLSVGEGGDLGASEAPIGFSNGSYWVDVAQAEEGGFFTLTSTGTVRAEEITVQVVYQSSGTGVFDHALFAGNRSEDPLYSMDLGGVGAQGDEVLGDVYSGGDLVLSDDAMVSGTLRAEGVIEGGLGETGVSQPIPDLQGMDFENTADFDVLELFLADDYSYQYDAAGGKAYQVPEDNPAHIFRINPSDRKSEYKSTEKLDFFLEDPYETVTSDSGQDGSNAYQVSVTGEGGEPGPDGNGKVYYIDGNLWVHNKKTYSFLFGTPESDGVQVTFVAKGNIYFSDNVFYGDDALDGVAFIALADEKVEDSGNIYFGDAVFGTLEEMNAFMYADNDFHDVNLDASGSSSVVVNGMMTAGNHVAIQRDYGEAHTKLTVNFDDRFSTGELELPGLAVFDQSEGGDLELLAWHIVGGAE